VAVITKRRIWGFLSQQNVKYGIYGYAGRAALGYSPDQRQKCEKKNVAVTSTPALGYQARWKNTLVGDKTCWMPCAVDLRPSKAEELLRDYLPIKRQLNIVSHHGCLGYLFYGLAGTAHLCTLEGCTEGNRN
jgi:hypothetical protein